MRHLIFTAQKQICSLLFVLACNFSLSAQNNTHALEKLQSYVDNIQVFNQLHPQEKVYLHMDNTGYYLGETIWFKAYVVNADTHLTTVTSNVLYVELVNPQGKVLLTKKIEIKEKECAGEFYLQTINLDYHAGFYEIRAYTRMMLNFGEETIFSRVFPVFNTPDREGEYIERMKKEKGLDKPSFKNQRPKMKKRKRVNIDFYPEGGNLVSGCKSRIAFKATDEDGYPIKVSGRVINRDKETIVTFKTQHEGMGYFEYIPEAIDTEVIVEYDNKTYKAKLPEVTGPGYSMSVNALHPKDIIVNINKSESSPPTQLGLTIISRGNIIHFQTVNIRSEIFFKLPKSNLPIGVNQITLFDNEGRIHSERLFFISPHDNKIYNLKIEQDKKIYDSHEKITLNFTGMPGAKFSLSVRDRDNIPRTGDSGNILTTLLLTSDLKGYIANPSSYFSTENQERLPALDLLMMVQGWRRYEWQVMAGVKDLTLFHPLEKGLMVDGHVKGKSRQVKFEFPLADGRFVEGYAEVDSRGRFFCPIDTAIYGDYTMLLQSPGLKNANMNIRLDRWFSPSPKEYSKLETVGSCQDSDNMDKTIIDSDLNKYIERKNIEADSLGIQSMEYEINDIVISQRRGGKDLIYDVEEDRERMIDIGERYPDIVHYYLVDKSDGYIFKAFTGNGENDNNPYVGGSYRWNGFFFDMRYMVDDTKWEYLLRFNICGYVNMSPHIELEEVRKIVVKDWNIFTRHFPQANKSVTAIPGYFYCYDKNSSYHPFRKNSDYRVVTFRGYSKMKDFYTGRPEREEYIPTKNEHSRTLYWNPNIQLDESGKTNISFYNNHRCRRIDISAEGIKNGIPFIYEHD